MVAINKMRLWYLAHKWSSLICTVFMFMLCLTGLPLIFAQEIDDWQNSEPEFASMPADTPRANLDHLLELAGKRYPNQVVTSVFISTDEPKVVVNMAPSWQESVSVPDSNHWLKFDVRTAEVVKLSPPPAAEKMSVLGFFQRLHIDMFLLLPGQLFLAFMAILLIVAMVSGVVLYGPFMKKLEFGTVRTERTPRLKWLDLHNLLGIVSLVWFTVVGATGILNELSLPLFTHWLNTDVQHILQPWQGKTPPQQSEFASFQQAIDTAKKALPGFDIKNTTFPGNQYGSAYHYVFWANGDTPLTARLLTPVLVDARTGALTTIVDMPWYLRALDLSRPLHFGDYGGLPLKIIWALLDLLTMLVLGSGIYLWLARRNSVSQRNQRLLNVETTTGARLSK